MKMVRRIAGGKHVSPRKIREAAHRIMLDYADEEDLAMVMNFIE